MRVSKIGVAVIGLVPFNVYAECTPAPDCASIGYTETSCEGKFVRCPFDTSKLFCIPCDSSFQYDCSGENITGGIGSACGGKYVSCECSYGAIFDNGNCICDTSGSVGNIYYSDNSFSSCLEASKTPIGVVVKENEIIIGNNILYAKWSADSTNISGLDDILDRELAKQDYAGQIKTQAIAAHYGTSVNTADYAGIYCYTYAPLGLEDSQGKWYLPALGELNDYVYANYSKIKSTWDILNVTYIEEWFWSSTESHSGGAWDMYISNGSTASGSNKNNGYSAACLLNL